MPFIKNRHCIFCGSSGISKKTSKNMKCCCTGFFLKHTWTVFAFCLPWSSWTCSGRGQVGIQRCHQTARVYVKGVKECDCLFGISKMVCGIAFVKLNPWKKCTLVKLGLYQLLNYLQCYWLDTKNWGRYSYHKFHTFGYIQAFHLTPFPASQ